MQWLSNWFMNNPRLVVKQSLIVLGIVCSTILNFSIDVYTFKFIPLVIFGVFLLCYTLIVSYVTVKIDPEQLTWSQIPLLFWSYKIKIKLQDKFFKDMVDIMIWISENVNGKYYYSAKKRIFYFQKKNDAVAFKMMYGEQCNA